MRPANDWQKRVCHSSFDRDQAWRDYAGWRVNYDTVLLALADLIMAPYAPWTSDRSAPDHVRSRIRLWGLAARRRGRQRESS